MDGMWILLHAAETRHTLQLSLALKFAPSSTPDSKGKRMSTHPILDHVIANSQAIAAQVHAVVKHVLSGLHHAHSVRAR
jgi:hypothetical protein